MKSIRNSLSCAVEALQEGKRASEKTGLNREQTNLMRLVTEEMISMTMEILKDCKGSIASINPDCSASSRRT